MIKWSLKKTPLLLIKNEISPNVDLISPCWFVYIKHLSSNYSLSNYPVQRITSFTLLLKHSVRGRRFVDRHEAKPFEVVTVRTLAREDWVQVSGNDHDTEIREETRERSKFRVFFNLSISINANYLTYEDSFQKSKRQRHS